MTDKLKYKKDQSRAFYRRRKPTPKQIEWWIKSNTWRKEVREDVAKAAARRNPRLFGLQKKKSRPPNKRSSTSRGRALGRKIRLERTRLEEENRSKKEAEAIRLKTLANRPKLASSFAIGNQRYYTDWVPPHHPLCRIVKVQIGKSVNFTVDHAYGCFQDNEDEGLIRFLRQASRASSAKK